MQYAVFSNKGKVRIDNEDSYFISENPYPVFAVADGMGGHQAGEVASKLAVKSLEDYEFEFVNISSEINEFINKANKLILEKGQSELEYEGMGTTLSMGIIYENQLYIGHVGDSRIYLFRDNDLTQLTTDHSLVNKLLERKEITSQEAFDHPQKNIITQALGTSTNLEIENKEFDLLQGDRLLFCTDGLHDMLRFNEIMDIFINGDGIETISSVLGENALEKGGNDNITLIIVDIN